MYELKINGKNYKIRYSYDVLCGTDLIDRVLAANADGDVSGAEVLKRLINLTADLLLAGLQRYHSDEYGYATESERAEALKKVYRLIDDYEDGQPLDEDGKPIRDAVDLSNELQGELMRNGFLSRIAARMAELQAEAAVTTETAVETAMTTETPTPAQTVARIAKTRKPKN